MHTSILILIAIRWSRDLACRVCRACECCRNSLGGCSGSTTYFFRLSQQIDTSIYYRHRTSVPCMSFFPFFFHSRRMESIQCWKFSNQIHNEHKHARSSADSFVLLRFQPDLLATWTNALELASNLALRFIYSTNTERAFSSFAISFVIYLNFLRSGSFVCVIHSNECAKQYINALCSIARNISYIFFDYFTVCFNPKQTNTPFCGTTRCKMARNRVQFDSW